VTVTAETLNSHGLAYTQAFPHFEENRIVHVAYGHHIARSIEQRGARTVLSLGVGHTEVAQPLLALLRAGRIDRYVLVDGAPAILEAFAKSTEPHPAGLTLVESFFEQFDTAERFDVIEAGFILEHVEDPALVLKRIHHLLAPGGRMFIAVPNATSLHRQIGHLAGLLPDMYALSAADHDLGHRRYFDVERLRSLVQACGYQVQHTEGLLLKPFMTSQMAALALAPAVWDGLQQVAHAYPELSNSFFMEVTA
jgi:SAM-dependent methyltransferase